MGPSCATCRQRHHLCPYESAARAKCWELEARKVNTKVSSFQQQNPSHEAWGTMLSWAVERAKSVQGSQIRACVHTANRFLLESAVPACIFMSARLRSLLHDLRPAHLPQRSDNGLL